MSSARKAKPRRTYGSGSIYQRPDGRYIGSIHSGFTESGARRRVVVSAKTLPEVTAKLKELQRANNPDEYVANRARTVKSWTEEWLEIQALKLRPKSMSSYRSACRKWIIPTLGHRRLAALTPADLRKLAKAQAAVGNSTSNARHVHHVMLIALRAAIVEGYPVQPRLLVMPAPPVSHNDRRAMTVAEAVALVREAARLPDGSRWLVALYAGLRQGEALGLTWDRVDLDAGVIYVSQQLASLPYLDRTVGTFAVPQNSDAVHLEKAWHLVRPKTAKGFRIVPLVPSLVHALRVWREMAPASPYDLVWPRLDGRPVYSGQDREEWWALQGAAGIGHPAGRYYKLHEARNTTATLLLEAKVDTAVVQAILGHSTMETSRGYMHVEQTLARQALDKVAARLEIDRNPSAASLRALSA